MNRVNPHVAPAESVFDVTLPSNRAKQSPHFNLLDFVWNLGEGVTTDMQGKYVGGGAGYGAGNYPTSPPAPGTFQIGVNVSPAPVPGGGWSTVTIAGQSITTYRGFLDVGLQGNANEAAFFLAFPATWSSDPVRSPRSSWTSSPTLLRQGEIRGRWILVKTESRRSTWPGVLVSVA